MNSRLPGLPLIACLAIVACSQKPSSPDLQRPPMAQNSTPDLDQNDPCSLLEPKEVEAVLGAPLGTPPYRASSSTPAADGSDCVYQTANFHTIIFTVEFTDGAQAYKMTGFAGKLLANAPTESARKAFKADDGTEIAGEWDEANLTAMNCCIFNAVRADQMITIDFTGSEATLPQAASLVDAAYKRIDKPLKLDGGANVAAAVAFLKTRPKRVAACSLLSKSEVEAILGPLAAPPVSNNGDPTGVSTSCEYHVPPEKGLPRSYELNIRWQGGYYEVRSDAHTVGLAGAAMHVTTKEVEAMRPGSPPPAADADAAPDAEQETDGAAKKADIGLPPLGAPGDPWERGGMVFNDFVALKKDVEVKIDHRTLDDAKVKALVAAAVRKF